MRRRGCWMRRRRILGREAVATSYAVFQVRGKTLVILGNAKGLCSATRRSGGVRTAVG
jgi:hypothetical protein